ncbi:MAG: WD40/YVTN/BNR-like repeat-containing protein [Desulfuromonadaceae bacterium]
MKEYLAEITVYSAGAEKTLYFSTHGSVVGTTYYEPRILHPGILKMMLFSDGTTMGKSTVGYGELRLINTDGALDYLLDAGFAGRTVLIKILIAGVATLLMSCSMEQPTYDATTLNVRIKDPQQALTVPVQPNKYGGTNVLPDGNDGVADIKGKPKPLLHGQVSNVTPVCVNTSRLIYQLRDGALQSITNVRDKGVALVAGVDRATNELLHANPPAAGTYDTCLAEGLFRLGSSPFGTVTADALQGATAADRTVAKIAAELFSVLNTGYHGPDFTTLDTINSSVIGIYISEEMPLSTALDEVFNSIGAWYGFDTSGVLRTSRLGYSSGTADVELTKTEIASLDRLVTQDEGRGVPAWKVNVNYDKNYTVQDAASLAGRLLRQAYFETATTATGIPWTGLTYGNGMFVGIGADGGATTNTLTTSPDGKKWTTRALPVADRWASVAYGLTNAGTGLFVAVPETPGAGTVYATSPDGITWTQRTFPYSNAFWFVGYGNGLFVVCSYDYFYTSPDGVNWTQRTIPVQGIYRDLVYANGIFVVVGSCILTSPDGVTWTQRTSPGAGGTQGVTYGNGIFVVALNGLNFIKSVDGITWTATPVPISGYWYRVKYGNDGFLATASYGTNVMISQDGITWTVHNVPSASWATLAYGNGAFVSLSYWADGQVAIFRAAPDSLQAVYISKQYRTVTATKGTVKTTHLNASEITFNTLLVSEASAQTEATRQLNFRRVRRDYISAKIKRSALATIPHVGSIIKITYPRYGYDAGKLFVLIGFEIQLATDDLILQLWG